VLDVGCGAESISRDSPRGGATVTGVDLTSSAVALAKANFDQQGLTGQFRVASGEQLPFPSDSFDLVSHTVWSSTRRARALVAECRRVLKLGGDANHTRRARSSNSIHYLALVNTYEDK